jgi:DNA-binding CsgD family transcriptional regulator
MSVTRDNEFRQLTAIFSRCAQVRGAAVLVDGGIASGKTELLRALVDHATDNGALVLTAMGSQAEQTLPFGLIRQLSTNSIAADDPLDTIREDAARHVTASTVECDMTVPEDVRTVDRISTALLRLAADRPVLLAIDDVHYGDTFSLQCLLHLTRRLRTTRMLVVLNYSSSTGWTNLPFRAELLRQPTSRRIRLEPSPRSAVEDLLAQHVDADTARRLAPAYHELTGGNLLLLGGLIEDSTGDAGPAATPTPGDAFGDATLASLYRSSRLGQETARALAVLGETSCGLLAEVLGVDSVERPLRELSEAGLCTSGPRFRHPAIRAAVLRDVTDEQRDAIHYGAATVLHQQAASAEQIAPHLVATSAPLPPWATLVLREAAEQALARDDIAQCRGYLELASRIGNGHQQAAALATLSRVEWHANPARALHHMPRLMTALRERLLPFEQASVLTIRLFSQGHVDEGVKALTQLVESVSADDAEVAAEFRFFRRWLAATFPEVLNRLPARLHTIAERDVLVPWSAKSPKLQAAELLTTVLQNHSTVDTMLRVEQFLSTWRLNDATVKPLVSALLAAVYGDRLDIAEPWCDRLATEASDRAVTGWRATTSATRAEVALRRGRLAEADRHASTALGLIPAASWGVAIAGPVAVLVLANIRMGRMDLAANALDRSVPDEVLRSRYGLLYLHARGHYYLAAGEVQAAMADFHACGDLMSQWRIDRPAFVPWRTDLAQCLLRTGETDQARILVDQQLARTDRTSVRAYGISLRHLAQLLPPPERTNCLIEAVELLREAGDIFELGLALADLGQAHTALGEPDLARTALIRARTLLRQSHSEAAPSLELPQQPTADQAPDTDLSLLTDAELRVATLAAQGHTNREIGRQLYITVSTVEQHLTRVYRKLRVTRRSSLPAALQPNRRPRSPGRNEAQSCA